MVHTMPTLPPYVTSAQSIFDLLSQDLAILIIFKGYFFLFIFITSG